jgi:predicted phage terminase large subunit-like protein
MWFIEKLCQELQVAGLRLAKKQKRDKHFNVNIPPRSGKSVLISIMYPVWLWLHNPKLKIVSITHGADLASDLLVDAGNLIKTEWFQSRWGNSFKLTTDNTEELVNSYGGKRKAYGTGSKILGITADLLLLDDIMDSKTAESEAYRKSVMSFVRRDAFSRLDNKSISLILNIQQRLHIEDFSGWLQRNKADQYVHIKLPAESTTADNVSPREWYAHYQDGLLADVPGRLSRVDLANTKIDVGSLAYAQMFLQEPVAPGGGLFQEEWFQGPQVRISYQDFLARTQGKRVEWQVFVDGAETVDVKNDPTSVMLCCKFENRLYIKDLVWLRKPINLLLSWLEEFLKRKEAQGTPVRRVMVEGKSNGKSIINMMNASTCPVPFVEISQKFTKDSKFSRANRAVPFVEARKLVLIDDTGVGPGEKAWIEPFVQEVTSFTNGKGKTHDDAVDTMAYAIQNATQAKIGYH